MSNCVEWIEDMLGAIKESQNPQVSSMIEFCGKACASIHSKIGRAHV